jgi:predicted PurR-regulated permease PerM
MPIENYLDISWKTIWKVVLTIGIAYLLFLVRDILILLIFSLILSVLLKSVIDFFHRGRVPYWIATLFSYILVFGVIAGLLMISIPLILTEAREIVKSFPQYLSTVGPILQTIGIQGLETMENFDQGLQVLLSKVAGNIFNSLSTIMGNLFSFSFILLMALFISLQENAIEDLLLFFSPRRYYRRILVAWNRSRKEVFHWFGTRIICSLFIAAAYFLVFQLFNVEAALILALIGGALDFLPYIGPLIAIALAGVSIGIQISWETAILIAGILFIVQFIEGHVFSPLLIRKFTNLPLYLILLALTVGGKLFGILGAFLAIPVTAAIYRFVIDLKRGDYLSPEERVGSDEGQEQFIDDESKEEEKKEEGEEGDEWGKRIDISELDN